MTLAQFKEFYQHALNLTESDFKKFMDTIESPLPSTFRVTSTADSELILEKLRKYQFLTKIHFLDNVFTFDLHEKTPEYKEFIQFLVCQTNIGNIQRQEIVSMLPHIFLELKSNHTVLETCASPGSKTKQLLEVIKDGLIISNDKSVSRVNVLVSESMKKASDSFIVTQMDASAFPNLNIKLDRVCCDVPCSSDGTIRKNPSLLNSWSIKASTGLCALQFRILERSLELLSDDGILVYSTCSLNPIENEYVVNRILEAGRYELCCNSNRIQYSKMEDSKIVVRKGISKFNYEAYSFDNKELEKCIRILPHDQNTGGFFMAVFKRKEPLIHKEIQPVNKLIKNYYDVAPEIIENIRKLYRIEDTNSHFISLAKTFRNIYAVSDIAYNILSNNPKLNVVYAGIKAFSLTDLADSSYRVKSSYLELFNIRDDVEISFSDFLLLLRDKTVSFEQLSFRAMGHFSLSVQGISYKFCGFASENKVFLYIDENHRTAFKALYSIEAKV